MSQSGTYVFVVRDGAAYVQPVKVERVIGGEFVLRVRLRAARWSVTNGQLLFRTAQKSPCASRRQGHRQ